MHLRNGRATSADANSETRNSAHYVCPGRVSFDKRSYKLVTLEVEKIGRLGKSAYTLVDQLATSVSRRQGNGTLSRKGILKERLMQINSRTTQVTDHITWNPSIYGRPEG